jgi:hypothetical protein
MKAVWYFSCLLLLMGSDTRSVTHVRFRKSGMVYTTKRFVHVILRFDVKTLLEGCNQFLNETKSVTTFDRYTMEKLSSIKESLMRECDGIRVGRNNQRDKRQVIAAAVFAVGTVTGYFSNQWLHTHQQHSEDQEVVLLQIAQHQREQELFINKLTGQVKDEMRQLRAEASFAVIDRLEAVINRFTDHIHHLRVGVNSLYHQRLPKTLVSDETLKAIFLQVNHRAQEEGGVLPFKSMDQFLQFHATIHFNEGFFSAVIHVPIIDIKLELFQLDQAIVFFPSNHSAGFLSVQPKNGGMLAYREDGPFFTELSPEYLMSCMQINRHHFCTSLTLRRDMTTSCIGSLYLGHLPSVKALCEIHHHMDPWFVGASVGNRTILYAQTDLTYRVVCKNSTVTRIARGWSEESLSESCYLESEKFRFYPFTKPVMDLWSIHKFDWDPRVLIDPLILTDLMQFRNESSVLKGSAISVETILNRRMMLKKDSYNHLHFSLLYVLASLAFVINVVIFGYLYFRYFELRKQNTVVETS